MSLSATAAKQQAKEKYSEAPERDDDNANAATNNINGTALSA